MIVDINSASDLQEFMSIIGAEEIPIMATDHKGYTINTRRLIGLMILDRSKPVTLGVIGYDIRTLPVYKRLAKFEVVDT